MAANQDYYKILAVPRGASAARIKEVFRQKAMRYHPDHNPGNEAWANKKLQEIIEAYDVLGVPSRRRLYDRSLAASSTVPAGTETRTHTQSDSQIMVDVMRARSMPVLARMVAFACVFIDNFAKESKRTE